MQRFPQLPVAVSKTRLDAAICTIISLSCMLFATKNKPTFNISLLFKATFFFLHKSSQENRGVMTFGCCTQLSRFPWGRVYCFGKIITCGLSSQITFSLKPVTRWALFVLSAHTQLTICKQPCRGWASLFWQSGGKITGRRLSGSQWGVVYDGKR